MKYYYVLIIVLFTISANSQEMVHWIINKDAKTNCNFIKSGKFVNEETGDKTTEGYTIEFRGNIVTEKMENGKYYLKSKIKYTSKCSYEVKVLETNEPGYEELIGQTFYSEILETSKKDKLIKIRSKGTEWKILVLRKIEN